MSKVGSYNLIELVAKRSKKIQGLSELYLVTTDREVDDQLCSYFESLNIGKVVRGNPFNLVDRTQAAIKESKCDFFVRLNGDSPFPDFNLIQGSLQYIYNYDFVTNLWPERSFPYGISVEIVNCIKYLELIKYCTSEEAEHVTSHLYRLLRNGCDLKVKTIKSKRSFNLDEKYAIDTKEDLLLMNRLIRSVDPLEFCHD
jgi:spore coat polysaccharide biosynthesis protein SpsF (cytidylyltransferase family)